MTEARATKPGLAEHFESYTQQHHAATIGMWIFLSSELMLFGGMFLGFTVYRIVHTAAFAQMSSELHLWLGTINTAILLTSSATMALAVHSAREGNLKRSRAWLIPTVLLGVAFLVIKLSEWYLEYQDHLVPIAGWNFDAGQAQPGPARLFMAFYFVMTGIHSIHLTIGIGLVIALIVFIGRRSIPPENPDKIEIIGLYWHLVDIIWIVVYPLFYLTGS